VNESRFRQVKVDLLVDSSRVLVTGGVGFIGSHLVDRLMAEGHVVRVVDNLSSGSLDSVQHWLDSRRFEFIRGDLKRLAVAENAVKDVDFVYHLAANPEVRIGEVDPSIHFRENLLATFNVLEAMRRDPAARVLVFFSSSTVYGDATEIPTPENYGPLVPISVYGASKLGCEALVSSFSHMFGLRSLIFRLANIIGGRSQHGVIVAFVHKLRNDPGVLEILGDGTQNKSYLHVDDLVEAVFMCLQTFLQSDAQVDIFNVGSLDQINVKAIAEIVCSEMGLNNVRFELTGGVEGGRGWRGDVKLMLLSVDRLLNFGWRPRWNSTEAVRRVCRQILHDTKPKTSLMSCDSWVTRTSITPSPTRN
jgi:UDP-glucose 4-epimerase